MLWFWGPLFLPFFQHFLSICLEIVVSTSRTQGKGQNWGPTTMRTQFWTILDFTFEWFPGEFNIVNIHVHVGAQKYVVLSGSVLASQKLLAAKCPLFPKFYRTNLETAWILAPEKTIMFYQRAVPWRLPSTNQTFWVQQCFWKFERYEQSRKLDWRRPRTANREGHEMSRSWVNNGMWAILKQTLGTKSHQRVFVC